LKSSDRGRAIVVVYWGRGGGCSYVLKSSDRGGGAIVVVYWGRGGGGGDRSCSYVLGEQWYVGDIVIVYWEGG
jgi:hypothetical protein